jgi:hypothetical protein
MKRLNNEHIINTSQIIKPSGKKIVENLLMTLQVADGRVAMPEDGSIIIKQERPGQLYPAMKEISIIPSLLLLTVMGFAMFHLGWKMSFMVLLFAPFPTFIKLIGTPGSLKKRILILNRWVKIYASMNEKPGIWLLLICISLNNKVLIRQWKLQTSRINESRWIAVNQEPLKLLKK